jgi:hypothetical protein
MKAQVKPDDEVIVKPGTYREQVWVRKNGAAHSYITIESEVPCGAMLRPPSSATYSTINVQADHIKIEGFDALGTARCVSMKVSPSRWTLSGCRSHPSRPHAIAFLVIA